MKSYSLDKVLVTEYLKHMKSNAGITDDFKKTLGVLKASLQFQGSEKTYEKAAMIMITYLS